MTDFAELQRRTGAINVANGWRESGLGEPGTGVRVHQDIVELALITSEVSEAIEEVRDARGDKWYQPSGKPEGLRAELADVVIRAMDMADKRGFDLNADIEEKLAYNETRGYRHGGKAA